MNHTHHNHKKKKKQYTLFKINDNEYLEHMIPHHQVAVDISILHQKNQNLHLCKKF